MDQIKIGKILQRKEKVSGLHRLNWLKTGDEQQVCF